MNRPTGILKVAAILVLVSVGVFFIWLIQNKSTNIVYVANNGIDSGTCGHPDNPCRSISQALIHANANTTIQVGPGRYGDLNKNGTFGDPGEEFAQGDGMINVDKPVTVISSDGPLMTVLDADGASLSAVTVTASNAVFGRSKHGFLITGAKANGLSTSTAAVSNITVAGNIAFANEQGGIVVNGSANLVQDNFAGGNLAAGIAVFGTGSNIRNNIASNNDSQGFVMVGSGHVMRDNVASNNGSGFGIQGSDIQVIRNAALGNKLFGISLDTPGASATIHNNNIYGNNSVPLNGLVNCGIWNGSGKTITATGNYWGTPNGPGSAPSNNAGKNSGCDEQGSDTVVMPYAKKSY
ncbi:MAG: NosD domain-containing protein [Methylobacter sp.]